MGGGKTVSLLILLKVTPKSPSTCAREPMCVFIITDKTELVGEETIQTKGVGVMKDEELNLEEIESHTLGG